MEKYLKYIIDNNETSLLSRIYGVYEINIPGYDTMILFNQENLFEDINKQAMQL